jgi:hypothetical protein
MERKPGVGRTSAKYLFVGLKGNCGACLWPNCPLSILTVCALQGLAARRRSITIVVLMSHAIRAMHERLRFRQLSQDASDVRLDTRLVDWLA